MSNGDKDRTMLDDLYYSAFEDAVADTMRDTDSSLRYVKKRDMYVEWESDKPTSVADKILKDYIDGHARNVRIMHPTIKTARIMNMHNYVNTPHFHEDRSLISNSWSTNAIKLLVKTNAISVSMFVANEIMQRLRSDKSMTINNDVVRTFVEQELKNVYAIDSTMTAVDIDRHITFIYNKYVEEFTHFINGQIHAATCSDESSFIEHELRSCIMYQLAFGFVPYTSTGEESVKREERTYMDAAGRLAPPIGRLVEPANLLIIYDIAHRAVRVYNVLGGTECMMFSLNFGGGSAVYESSTRELMLGSVGENLLNQELIFYDIKNLYYSAQFPRYYVITERRPDPAADCGKRKRDDDSDDDDTAGDDAKDRAAERKSRLAELNDKLKRIRRYDDRADKLRQQSADTAIKRQNERLKQSHNIDKFSDHATGRIYGMLNDLSTKQGNMVQRSARQYHTFLQKNTNNNAKSASITRQLAELAENLRRFQPAEPGINDNTGLSVAYAAVEHTLKEYEPEIQKIVAISESLFVKVVEHKDKICSQMLAEVHQCMERAQTMDVDSRLMDDDNELMNIHSYTSAREFRGGEIPVAPVSDSMDVVEQLRLKTDHLHCINSSLFQHMHAHKEAYHDALKKGMDLYAKHELSKVENADLKQLFRKTTQLATVQIEELQTRVERLTIAMDNDKDAMLVAERSKIDPVVQNVSTAIQNLTGMTRGLDEWKDQIQTDILNRSSINDVTAIIYDDLLTEITANRAVAEAQATSLAEPQEQQPQRRERQIADRVKRSYKEMIKKNIARELADGGGDDERYSGLTTNGTLGNTQQSQRVSKSADRVIDMLYPQVTTININRVSSQSIDYAAVERNIIEPFMTHLYGAQLIGKYGSEAEYLKNTREVLDTVLTTKCVPLIIRNVVKGYVREKP